MKNFGTLIITEETGNKKLLLQLSENKAGKIQRAQVLVRKKCRPIMMV